MWGNRLVGGSCLCPRQQNKHTLLQSTCWQTCRATVVLKTTPLCYYAPGVELCPSSFVNGGYLWVKSCNHILPRAWDDHQCPFKNDDSEGQGVVIPGQPLQPLENNGASLLALCIYAVVGLWQSWCVSGQHMASSDWEQAGMVLITPALSLLEN